MRNQDVNVKAFVDNSLNHFFYTETVKSEVMVADNEAIPPVFTYIPSGLSDDTKNFAYTTLTENKFFICTSEGNKRKLSNNITIIFEAGFICFDKRIVPCNVHYIPLLTTNLKLYHKFIEEVNKKLVWFRTFNSLYTPRVITS